MSEEWYAPNSFSFTRNQIIWFIENFAVIVGDEEEKKWELVVERWVKDPQKIAILESNLKNRNPLEVILCVLAEINWRLKRTDDDGQQLLADIKAGATIYEDLTNRAKQALNYISGWKRRKIRYSIWQAKRRYRQKNIRQIQKTM